MPASWSPNSSVPLILVFVAVGVATLCFGFKLFGTSYAAGVVTTALAFGLVLMALVYAIGPISGCHVNPAVSLGFVISGRMEVTEAIGYWVAQVAGGHRRRLRPVRRVHRDRPSIRRASRASGPTDTDRRRGSVSMPVAHSPSRPSSPSSSSLVILFATSKVARESMAGLAIGVALVFCHLSGSP